MRATEFINEVFQNQTVPWKWMFRGSEEASALFTVGDVPYRFHCYTTNPKIWEVEFSVEDDEVRAANKDYEITGTGNAATVMSTVVGILKAFLVEYKDKIDALSFSAKEDSRQALYAKMVRRLLPDWGYYKQDDTFTLKTPKLVAAQEKQRAIFRKHNALMAAQARERELARQSEVTETETYQSPPQDVDDTSYDERVERVKSQVEKFARSNGVDAAFAPWVNSLGQTIAIELTDLFADNPGSGGGTKVMKLLCTLADEQKISVYLKPESGRNRNDFYPRFGFQNDKRNHGFMVRYPPWEDLDETKHLKRKEELTEYEQGTPASDKIISRLKSLGYEQLGGGFDATVWSKDAGSVVKILMPSRAIPGRASDADRGFLTFYEFCQQNDSPNLPKFVDIGGAHHTVFEIDGIPYRQIAMERLTPLTPNSFESYMIDMLASLAKIGAPWGNIVDMLKKPSTWASTDVGAYRSMPGMIKQKFADPVTYKHWGMLYITIGRLYKTGLKAGLGWDLHGDNVMQRADGTVVITDPYFT